MVDMETGGMIGIDFGHAFGSATQVLTSFSDLVLLLFQTFSYLYRVKCKASSLWGCVQLNVLKEK